MTTINQALETIFTEEEKPKRSAHSIWLDNDTYSTFYRLCTDKFGVSSSQMLDKLLPALVKHLEAAPGRNGVQDHGQGGNP